MAKSSTAREFRKVDVDKFDEDQFQDDQNEEEQYLGPSEGEIQQLLMSYPLPCSNTKLGPILLSQFFGAQLQSTAVQILKSLESILPKEQFREYIRITINVGLHCQFCYSVCIS